MALPSHDAHLQLEAATVDFVTQRKSIECPEPALYKALLLSDGHAVYGHMATHISVSRLRLPVVRGHEVDDWTKRIYVLRDMEGMSERQTHLLAILLLTGAAVAVHMQERFKTLVSCEERKDLLCRPFALDVFAIYFRVKPHTKDQQECVVEITRAIRDMFALVQTERQQRALLLLWLELEFARRTTSFKFAFKIGFDKCTATIKAQLAYPVDSRAERKAERDELYPVSRAEGVGEAEGIVDAPAATKKTLLNRKKKAAKKAKLQELQPGGPAFENDAALAAERNAMLGDLYLALLPADVDPHYARFTGALDRELPDTREREAIHFITNMLAIAAATRDSPLEKFNLLLGRIINAAHELRMTKTTTAAPSSMPFGVHAVVQGMTCCTNALHNLCDLLPPAAELVHSQQSAVSLLLLLLQVAMALKMRGAHRGVPCDDALIGQMNAAFERNGLAVVAPVAEAVRIPIDVSASSSSSSSSCDAASAEKKKKKRSE